MSDFIIVKGAKLAFFENEEDFSNRKDKEVNGFLKSSDIELCEMNLEGCVGCFEIYESYDCVDCYHSESIQDCKKVINCVDCYSCTYLMNCKECEGCNYCSFCLLGFDEDKIDNQSGAMLRGWEIEITREIRKAVQG